jgi:hypothetical protein
MEPPAASVDVAAWASVVELEMAGGQTHRPPRLMSNPPLFKNGDNVQCQWKTEDGGYYSGKIKRARRDGTFDRILVRSWR